MSKFHFRRRHYNRLLAHVRIATYLIIDIIVLMILDGGRASVLNSLLDVFN